MIERPDGILAIVRPRRSTRDALFLDLDGTLVDIAITPGGVTVPSDLVPLLTRVTAGLGGALAIITGRQVSDVDRFLAPLRPVAAGVHGAEVRLTADGPVQSVAGPLDPSVTRAVSQLAALSPGIVIEPKLYSIAVHYRLAPSAGPLVEDALRRILERGPDHLILCSGRKVIEVVPRNVSKGAALEALLALPPFEGRRPIMIGDDVSDESALAAAARLGGLGWRVAGEHFGREAADFEGPSGVRSWLLRFAETLGA